MKEMLEIRIHGRGGQGAKTASQFIAESGLEQGKFIKAFPEYGPERRGAPMVAYSRISDKPIHTYSPVRSPDIVIVIDDTLIPSANVTEGLGTKGILIVNSKMPKEEIRKKTMFRGKIFSVDASGIAISLIGKDLPNIPMLGAFIKVTGAITLESTEKNITGKFLKKIGEEKTNTTIESLKQGYHNVK